MKINCNKYLALVWGLVFFLSTNEIYANPSKWMSKAQKAVFSIITYDKEGKIKNTGNGFFISNDGYAVSDYRLMSGAEKAVIVTSDGKQMEISSIAGANEMYDVVRFRVDVPKKVNFLELASVAAQTGDEVYLLPYSTRKNKNIEKGTVRNSSKIEGNYTYYTINMPLQSKMVSCPILNKEGLVLGLLQKSSSNDTTSTCYAIDAAYANSLSVNALSVSDPVLNKIGITKELPAQENDALVYLFMAQSQFSTNKYMQLLDNFIEKFPNSSEGYLRKATAIISQPEQAGEKEQKEAEEYFEKAIKSTEKKDDVYYMIARAIYNFRLAAPDNQQVTWTLHDALEYLQEALEINLLPAYIQLQGDIFFAQNDYKKAFSCYEQVNSTELASPATFYNAAKTAQLDGQDIQKVCALMDSCMAHCNKPLNANDAVYALERADVNMRAQKYRQAWMDYNTYFTAVNGQVNDVFYYLRSQAATKSRQYQGALNDLAEAIRLNPTDPIYKAELAGLNLIVGQTESALQQLEELILSTPDYADAYRLKGLCLIQLKKNNEACICFQKAMELGDQLSEKLIEKYCAQ